MKRFSKALRGVLGMVIVAAGMTASSAALAQSAPEVTGQIEWGVWIDADGCMHWWADGGSEGYWCRAATPRPAGPSV